MSVRIIDSLEQLGGQLTALYPDKYVYDMPGYPKVLAKDLATNLSEQALQFDPEVVLEDTVHELNKDEEGYTLVTGTGNAYPTRTVIISAGVGAFAPTKLGLDEEESYLGKGLYYGVKKRELFEGKRVIVVGGGDSAFDWALNLNEIAEKVTLVHRRDVFKAHDHTVDLVKQSNVDMKLWYVTTALHGNGTLDSVTLQNTKTKEEEQIDADAMVVNIGFKTNLGPLKEWGLEIERNQIVVDANYQTVLPAVFAVGDVCTFPNKLKLIATGVGEAASAVCMAKTIVDPGAKLFPGHSSDMDVPAGASS
jgi:thioredoxin reductase (NADPH)